jgi:hypothetical protein
MARILKTIEVSSMTPCHTCFAQVSFRGWSTDAAVT